MVVYAQQEDASVNVIAQEGNAGTRLDKFLATAGLKLTRARAQKLIEQGAILVNGERAKRSYIIRGGEEISVEIPKPVRSTITAENIPLEIVYEDDDIVIVNKPVGMVTHPSAGHSGGTLVNAIMNHCKTLSGIGGVARPGIVHRLDKDTSGLIVVAKNDVAHQRIAEQLETRTLSRKYIAVVKGFLKQKHGRITSSIGRHPKDRKKMAVVTVGGKSAQSEYRTLQELEGASVVEVSLHTGRTHQVRVHMLSINNPVIGDTTYGRGAPQYSIKRQALHAWKLKLNLPSTGEEMEFQASPPSDILELIESLGGDVSGL